MRSTGGMTLAAGITILILKVSRLRDPRMERRLWLLVLGQGVLFVPMTVSLPILAPVRIAGVRVEQKSQTVLTPSDVAPSEEEVFDEKSLPKNEFAAAGSRSGEEYESSATGRNERPELGLPGGMPIQERRIHVSWPRLLVLIWGGGILCLVGMGVWRYRFWMRNLDSPGESEQEWLDEWKRLLKSKGIQREIPLVVVKQAGPALMWGKGGYRVVVPASRWKELDAGIREAILKHELTHYLRGHLWSGFLGRSLALVHWFNPVAWWVLRQLEQQAEFECDEAAVETDATQLAEGLMRLGRGGRSREPAFVHCVAGGRIHERVRRLLEERKPNARWKGYASVGIGLLAILAAEFPLKAIPATEPMSKEPAVAAPPNQKRAEEKTKAETTEAKVAEEESKPGPKLMYQLGSDLYRSVYGIQHLELTSDGKLSVAGAGARLSDTPTLNVFDTFTGEKLRTLRHPDNEGEELLSLAISPDDRLVLGGESGGWLTIWNLQSGEPLLRFQACETHITDILFHPSGKQFVCVGWDRKLFLRDLADPVKVVREFTATDSEETGPIDFSPACCGGFSEDGESLFVVSQAATLVGTDLAFWKWNVGDGKLVQSGRLPKIPEGKSISSIEFDPKVPEVVYVTNKLTPDSPLNASSRNGGNFPGELPKELIAISLKSNHESNEIFRREVEKFSSVIPTPKGVKLITKENAGIGWSVTGVRGETIEASYRDAQKRFDSFSSEGLRISRDGKAAVNKAVGKPVSYGQVFLSFDLEKGKLLNPEDCFLRQTFQTNSAWSNSSRFLATNFWQGFLSLVEVETGRVKWKVASGGSSYQPMAFTSNDEFVVVYDHVRMEGGFRRRVQLYRTENGKLVHELLVSEDDPVTYPGQVRQVAVTDDGKFVAVSCGRMNSETSRTPQMKVFNFETGEEVSARSNQVIPDEKRGYGQPPRERWQHWTYDDFTFVPGTHKLMLADSEWGMRKGNKSGEPAVILFNADEPTDVKETILDTVNEQEKELPGRRVLFPGMYFSRSGNRLVSLVHIMGVPEVSTAFCSWEFENGEYVGFERGPDLNQYFVIDRVLNDEFFVTQPLSRHSDGSIEMIQYRSLRDGSILREFAPGRDGFAHLERELGLASRVFAHLMVISPDGEKTIVPVMSGNMQMWDLSNVRAK